MNLFSLSCFNLRRKALGAAAVEEEGGIDQLGEAAS